MIATILEYGGIAIAVGLVFAGVSTVRAKA